MMHQIKDKLWKCTIESFSDAFVRFFYKDAEDLFDLSAGFLFLDKELQQLNLNPPKLQNIRRRNMLLQGRSAQRNTIPVIVLVEVQGYKDRLFAKRVFNYFLRLAAKYDEQVLVLVIYTDGNKSYHPSMIYSEKGDTSHHFTFKTYKVLDQQEEALAADPNVFGLIVLTVLYDIIHAKKGTDASLFAMKKKLLLNLKNRHLPTLDEAKVLAFISLYTAFDNSKMYAKFEKEIELIIKNQNTMDFFEEIRLVFMQDYERAILKKRNTLLVSNLLKKGKLSIKEISEVTEVSLGFVKAIKQKLAI